MIFLDLPAGADVFVDANVFLHHFGPDPQYGPPSTDLLLRIKRKQIAGFTSTHIIGEIAHRMMTIEAMKRFGWKSAGIAQRLRQNPTEVKQLVANGINLRPAGPKSVKLGRLGSYAFCLVCRSRGRSTLS